MTAAMGKQLKQSINVFHNLMLYLRLPISGVNTREPTQVQHAVRTLVIEAVDSVDARVLVVTSQEEEILRVLDFVGE
jgi:hypothetical protein